MSYFFQRTKSKKSEMLAVAISFAISTVPALANASTAESYNIAVYRGQAGCSGCSEMVVKSLVKTGLPLRISYVGEKERLKLNAQTLKKFDLYIQPGGGQDIPGSYQALGDEGADAIRQFVKSGKSFMGICMGAYLADKDWIGLIDAPLESEVARPGSDALDQGDYTLQLTWNNKQEPFYYQDGPYLNGSSSSTGFQALAYYENGDIAIARYKYGKGNVILSGPHPEADETWIDSTAVGNTTAESKMQRILSYLDIKKS
ncbi:BPL-N domain-containing protein [Raoultella terrigena]|uniref:Biotin-protein ligase N-terminal domain-containing protein n=1 Tax=Raoultella terrigena TaxID=577 RepID=A0AAP9XWG4_RAOTE|nr:BPL-N domain-containing protein [Raoultella terrigena]QPF11188.1 hypothetical protein IMO34_12885 [Raoultella terrigena]WJV41438.1 BPL-N domain-containing protein [Raoultella terrigena]VTM13287.1 Uncharacterized conserved protein [Raoultella terrigena]VUD34010.1 Uncharacterized conserved protein [Raoultella sp. NCTC 9187]